MSALSRADFLVSAAAPALRCALPGASAPGWQRSYQAGCEDRHGHLLGGSEMMHLVPHKGKLYAANGYWEDSRNMWYGGSSPANGWAQVLRLDGADAVWESDLELGPRHLRTEILKSLTFATDDDGRPLPEPVELLVAAGWNGIGTGGVDVFVRDDVKGSWQTTRVLSGVKGDDAATRAMTVHRDAVTGVDRAFMSIGIHGIFSGVYDAQSPGRIRWDRQPESGPTQTRILALTEANGSLFFSEGMKIYRRVDGPAPRYLLVVDMSDVRDEGATRTQLSEIGGVRGLTAIANPNGAGESLIFLWASGPRSQGCIFRLDPDGSGGYVRKREQCLAPLVSAYLGHVPVPYVLGNYNALFPVRDPVTQEVVSLIGLAAFVAQNPYSPAAKIPTAPNQRKTTGGFYAGGLYAIRDAKGRYRISEVAGPPSPSLPALVSVRAFAMSPFPEDRGNVVYFAGYDGNDSPSSDTAWIFRADTPTVLGKNPVLTR
jgi:hypothetical protein